MKSWRFFVTGVFFVSTATLTACEAFHSAKPSKGGTSFEQLKSGNAKIDQATVIEQELGSKLYINLQGLRDPRGKLVTPAVLASDYNWRRLSKDERHSAKEKLSLYIALASEVLELDARKGIYVTNKDQVIAKRDAAIGFLRALENFEKTFGENFEPKPGSQQLPPYSQGWDA